MKLEKENILRLHVSLREIQPPIWRRVELSSRTTLKQFHRILQIAMGWENCHLHEYMVDGQRYATPDPDFDGPDKTISETGVRLADLLPAVGAEMLYIYDYGDYWQHEVRLEAMTAPEAGAQYPRIVGGSRSCPPEDCGGTGGYANLLEVLLDPTDEEFEHMRNWVGPKFNAEVFSANSTNERLRKYRSLAAKR